MCKQRKFLAIGSGAGILSVLLPWITIGGFLNFNGLSLAKLTNSAPVGVIVLLLMIGALVLALLGDKQSPLSGGKMYGVIACGGASLLLGILAFVKISQHLGNPGSSKIARGLAKAAGTGFGLYLLLIAAVAVIIVPFVIKESSAAPSGE